MGASINKVILIGHLGDEVKTHYFDQENCIGRFSLATNESYKSKDSAERVVHTEWHKIVVRQKLAMLCEEYLSKGDQVYIEGKLKTRQWNDHGVDRYVTEIHANSIKFLSIKKNTKTSSSVDAK